MIRNMVKSLGERKFIDFQTTGTLNSISAGTGLSSPFLIDLSEVTQGVTDQTRVGDKLTVSSIELRFLFWFTTDVDYVVRCIVFKWFDDTTPVIADILQVNTNAIATILSPLNHDKKVKRKLMMDKTWEGSTRLTGTSIGSNPVLTQHFINVKGKAEKVQSIAYQAGSTIGVGKFYMLVIGVSPSANGYPTQVSTSIWHRLNYTDM